MARPVCKGIFPSSARPLSLLQRNRLLEGFLRPRWRYAHSRPEHPPGVESAAPRPRPSAALFHRQAIYSIHPPGPQHPGQRAPRLPPRPTTPTPPGQSPPDDELSPRRAIPCPGASPRARRRIRQLQHWDGRVSSSASAHRPSGLSRSTTWATPLRASWGISRRTHRSPRSPRRRTSFCSPPLVNSTWDQTRTMPPVTVPILLADRRFDQRRRRSAAPTPGMDDRLTPSSSFVQRINSVSQAVIVHRPRPIGPVRRRPA